MADSAEDRFSPFSFECSAINNRGDIVGSALGINPEIGQLILRGLLAAEVPA